MANVTRKVGKLIPYLAPALESQYIQLHDRPGMKDCLTMPRYLYWPVLHHENKS